MQLPKCTHCGKPSCAHGDPTVHVLEVAGGEVVEQHCLCEAAAVELGFVQKAMSPLGMAPALIEKILSDSKKAGRRAQRRREPACAGCGMTSAEFHARGQCGCARCCETFREPLLGLLDRVHDSRKHCGRHPVRPDTPGLAAADPDSPGTETTVTAVPRAELDRRLQAAIAAEDFEAAARLRDQIQRDKTRGDETRGDEARPKRHDGGATGSTPGTEPS